MIVLPQRALVEQTVEVTEGCIGNLGLDVPVHVLMGGEDVGDRAWKLHPELMGPGLPTSLQLQGMWEAMVTR